MFSERHNEFLESPPRGSPLKNEQNENLASQSPGPKQEKLEDAHIGCEEPRDEGVSSDSKRSLDQSCSQECKIEILEQKLTMQLPSLYFRRVERFVTKLMKLQLKLNLQILILPVTSNL